MSTPAVVPKKLILPFILITFLFALWGFANDITNPMVAAFKRVLELNNFQASLVQLAFYGGYFTMALPAALFIKKYSYKKGIIIGLLLYAVGSLFFYPAAYNESFGFFLLALYILTFGLAFLETTANPYILSMGPEATATQRLNLAQAFNPMGALAGLFIAKRYILERLQSNELAEGGSYLYYTLNESEKSVVRTHDLMIIRDPYVLLGIFVIFIIILIYLTKMPESKDTNHFSISNSIGNLYKIQHFREGVIAQMFYVGAQIMCWTYIYQYAEALGISNDSAVNYGYAALIFFLAGRWICTFLLRFTHAGRLLLIFSIMAIISTICTIFIYGIIGLYALVSTSFFMSLMFPTIYGIALKGLGNDTKIGAAFLVMAIVGGAILPTLQGLIMDLGGSGYDDILILGVPEVNFSFILPLFCFLIVALYSYRVINIHLIKE